MSLHDVLTKLVDKKVIGYRFGENGFDLILENGDELEVYGGLSYNGECLWGVSYSERYLIPVENCDTAREIVNDVLRNTKYGDISTTSTSKGCFVSVDKNELKEIKQECDKLDKARPYLC